MAQQLKKGLVVMGSLAAVAAFTFLGAAFMGPLTFLLSYVQPQVGSFRIAAKRAATLILGLGGITFPFVIFFSGVGAWPQAVAVGGLFFAIAGLTREYHWLRSGLLVRSAAHQKSTLNAATYNHETTNHPTIETTKKSE